MAKLIDADARVTVNSFDPMNEEYSSCEMSVADALDFVTDKGWSTFIDAIPVEWLKGLMLSTEDDVDKVKLAWILREWESEQKEQEVT